MPKLKTHKGAAKRIKRTGSGKLQRRRAFRSHNFSAKSSSCKRNYTREFELTGGNEANVKKLLGI